MNSVSIVSADDQHFMRRAIELAQQGEGWVEPNPMVGCVIVSDGEIIGEGWHTRFGSPHAEVEALQDAHRRAPNRVAGSTAFVSLEPCCHHGKTPPCTEALIRAEVKRVVIGHPDPFPRVDGGGIKRLADAGIQTDVGLLQVHAQSILDPYLMRVRHSRPWVIAKWAMTLDGRTATKNHHSKWISNSTSRQIVHQIRGRVDGVIVGRQTVEDDDPQLTARPAGARIASRIVFDSGARISLSSKLVQSSREIPLIVFVDGQADTDRVNQLSDAGVIVERVDNLKSQNGLRQSLQFLNSREMTNVLLEGGGELCGAFFDSKLVDECHVFLSMKLAGGKNATSPIAGQGVETMDQTFELINPETKHVDGDLYISGKLRRSES